ncbi:hypothetical protein HMPREF1050_0109 [Haemophilus parahaemolyticus HK385]|uniref:Uncharacterized protein n=1 Tax=Haemophilus parahaemolyticus HK385 TaxID=1095744 RepID=A0ABP2P4Z2_HAEPH|nr:hypothetical protein HMPREF1050_0109 [Haemophilus parahaemolyticus HK385]
MSIHLAYFFIQKWNNLSYFDKFILCPNKIYKKMHLPKLMPR